ncbi:MAG: chromosome segregation protein SMC, partial [bacterium]|nr:chromosome segregation protein SMC [bacterium]
MYLSRLEMVGFKSFGVKTDLGFNDGITAIVGPNGCGKTNIVDAIRWVLGEQKTAMLRADSMEHVIFNGSKTRKPLGMAEVSLTIENNRQILPTEYAQVVITRRLFRNGESQYLLNKTQCRLRDIVDLFMDTGMGSDAYSVIELKMIETILSDKAEERRHLFEEAAGVTKYKARRKEAVRKLEYAQRDIARVQDIVREVHKTVNSLARQADKARQHQELSTRLRELDRLLFAFEYAEEYIALTQLQTQVNSVRVRREAAEGAVSAADLAVSAAEREHEQLEQKLRTALDNESTVRASLSEAQQQISLVEERAASANRALERIEREHTESHGQQRTTEEELVAVRTRLETIRTETEKAKHEAESKRLLVLDATGQLQNVKSDAAQKRESLQHARQILNDEKGNTDRYRVQSEAIKRRLADSAVQNTHIEERLRTVDAQLAQESQDMPALDAALQDAEQRLHAGETREKELRGEQETLQGEADTKRATLAHSRASLEFLTALVDTAESSKFLLASSEWTPQGEKLTLAEVINTGEEYRIAIEAALGEAGRYFVVANRKEAQQAIGALSRNNVGKATFLCRDSIPTLPPPAPLPNTSGVLGWASELVQTDEALRGALRGILGRTIIVTTVDDAWSAVGAGGVDTAVTVSGEIVNAAGAVRGGSASRTEGVRIGRRERIEQLTLEIAALEQQVNDIDERLQEIKRELGSIDLRSMGEFVRKAALIRNERAQRIDALRGRIEDANTQREALQKEVNQFNDEVATLQHSASESDKLVVEMESALARMESDLSSVLQTQHDAERQLDAATNDARNAELHYVRLNGEEQSLHTDEGRLSSQSMTLDQRREQRETERTELQQQIAAHASETETLQMAASTVAAQLTEAKSAREATELSVREGSATFHAAGEAVRARRKDLDALTNEGHTLDLKFNEVRLRMEVLSRRAVEELDIEVPEPTTPPEMPESEQNPEELRAQVLELRRKLTSMGNVNFLALEEHEREAERLAFLTQQLNDLVESERTLQETIAEINRTAREKFTETFVRIRENFSTLFKMLFSEDDEADLQMSDDSDPLECRVDIIAKPRGKRPHSIEMLSGGEKTLTAIALLFAIYLVKPSPFCILDEVDAPLDDANIDRYLRLIRKFSENTQFLMITHNKKTMEAADTLYGVTMEE